jgi:integrase
MTKNHAIKFYTGGVDVKKWSSLTPNEKKESLRKSWYVRWYFLNPKTNKLERQGNIKSGVNRLSKMTDRIKRLKKIKNHVKKAIKDGYSPYEKINDNFETEKKYINIKDALKKAHDHSNLTVSKVTSNDYFYAKEQFLKFIGSTNQLKDIKEVNKTTVLKFLNNKLEKTSARTRNNYKSSLSALFTVLENKLNLIERNFIKDISNEKTKVKTDRTFTKTELKNIVEWLKYTDPYLLTYIRFIAYNFLRPVEVNRLKVKDINLEESLLYFQAKNKPLKIKRIPSIFIDDIKSLNLHLYNAEHFLFTPKNEPSEWNSSDNSRRDTFSKRFKIVKNKFNLGSQYGLYSFRHSFITNLFRYLRSVEKKSYSEAIEVLQPITGHETRVALERYIHQIDADIPEDWSDKIDFIL